MLAEEEFQKLDRIASYNTKVDPCYYAAILVLSFFGFFLSIWYMVFTFMNIALKVNDRYINPMMDSYLY